MFTKPRRAPTHVKFSANPGLSVADLAAGLLAAIRGERYDWRADIDARQRAREKLKERHGR